MNQLRVKATNQPTTKLKQQMQKKFKLKFNKKNTINNNNNISKKRKQVYQQPTRIAVTSQEQQTT